MKGFTFVAAVSGLALLEGVAAVSGCCRKDPCQKAVAAPENSGVADCSTNLFFTVTASASTVTVTTTAVESAVATALFTETDTTTASTETLLFTESTTVTASTETDVDALTVTFPVTVTAVVTVATVTTTATNYQQLLKARSTSSATVPAYASACLPWDRYVKACKCAGVEPTTITVPAPQVTVTVQADEPVTSVISTASLTSTSIVSLTTTTSTTETNVISLTETITTSPIISVYSTTTTTQTTTATSVVPVYCRPVGQSMRILSPYTDGTTRGLNVALGLTTLAWQTGIQTTGTGSNTYSYTWTLDANGYLELANKIGTAASVLAPYVDLTAATGLAPSVLILAKARTDVEAARAAGTYARLKGCVNAATNEVTFSVGGRANILLCGNMFYMSNGTGSELTYTCTRLFPTATLV